MSLKHHFDRRVPLLSAPAQRRRQPILLAVLSLLLCLGLLSGCLGENPETGPEPAYTPTPTPTHTPTVTPHPLGSPGNPLILAAVTGTAPDSFPPAQDLAAQLTSLTGVTVTAREFSTYEDIILNLSNGDAHIAWMPPLTYLLAARRGIAEVALLTNRFGVYLYGTQIMANVASGFTAYYDPITGENTAEPAVALAQLAGKRPCYVDPGSTAGYVVPAGLLASTQIPVLEPAFVQGHPAVVRALYIQGVCDFGATFSISGDPRTADSVLGDLLDAQSRIVILYQSDAVIPNLNLSYLSGLPEEMRFKLNTAFLDLAATPEGRALLSAAAGNYQVEALRVIDDTTYDPLRQLVEAIDLNLGQLIGR